MRFSVPILLIVSLWRGLTAADADSRKSTNTLPITTQLILQLAEEARTNNPSFLATNARVKAAELNAAAVRTWEDPTAMVGGSVFSDKGFDPAEEGDLVYGVEQKLPL